MNVLVRDESLDEVLDASISRKAEPLAIVGMSCRFPTDADTLEKILAASGQRPDHGRRNTAKPMGSLCLLIAESDCSSVLCDATRLLPF
ncbi:hypothetical protein O3W47_03280 [Agrobacterium sp. LMR679]|nr:hypothetical protein [Agrobacterium sp. LMR679]MCZ4072137.1 hypothetical protein [Agrobacterium sp. LMR679]